MIIFNQDNKTLVRYDTGQEIELRFNEGKTEYYEDDHKITNEVFIYEIEQSITALCGG